jgi:hypothetical protein
MAETLTIIILLMFKQISLQDDSVFCGELQTPSLLFKLSYIEMSEKIKSNSLLNMDILQLDVCEGARSRQVQTIRRDPGKESQNVVFVACSLIPAPTIHAGQHESLFFYL